MALHERTLQFPADVTVVGFDGADGCLRGRAVAHDSDGLIKIDVGRGRVRLRVRYDEEGVRWARGHHRDGTPGAEALLAAVKLVRMVE